jgi:hypothetical protein
MTELRYKVTFEGPVEEATRALQAAGLDRYSSSGDQYPETAEELDLRHHAVFLDADDEQSALNRVKAAVEDHGDFANFEVEQQEDA